MSQEGIVWAPVLQVCRHKTALLGSHRVKAGMQRQAGQKLGAEKQKSVETKPAAAEERGAGSTTAAQEASCSQTDTEL